MQLIHPHFTRITIDPQVCFGKPCIRGLRMPVASVLDYLGSGMTYEALLENFPFLDKEDILEALNFSALMLQDRFLPLQNAS